MRIRCERCATLYHLAPSLLPPGGGPVQCTRCGHVFLASPPIPDPVAAVVPHEAITPAGMPPTAAIARRPAAGPVAGARAPGPKGRKSAAAPKPPDRRPAESVATVAVPKAAPPPAPPSPSAPPLAVAAPPAATPAPEFPPTTPDDLAEAFFAAAPAGDGAEPEPEVIAFEQGLQRKRRIVVGTLIGVVGLAAVAFLATVLVRELGGPSHDPAAVAKVDRLLAAVRTGSPGAALEAVPLGDEALAIEPEFLRARADRGLALLLAAMERKDAADRVAARRQPIERELRKAEESGDPEATKAPLAALEALKAEYDPVLAAYGKLKADADAAIEGAYRDGADDPAAVRAMGMLRASGGDEKNAPILAANYRKLAGDGDGWPELIEGQLHAAGRAAPEKRAKAVERLTAALEKAPDLGIASLLLGRVRFELQDLDGARKDLGRALAAGPGNELARRWIADLEVPSAARPGEPAAAPADPTAAAAPAPAGATPSPAAPAAG